MNIATQKEPESTVEERFREFLEKPGVPYEKQLIQFHFPRVLAILSGENPPPYELEIQPSARCNAYCNHCWARNFEKVEERLYSAEAMKRILDQAVNFEENGFKIEIVKFCGSTGEPLVNPLTIDAIASLQGKRYTRLFTNGIKLGENKNSSYYLEAVSKLNKLNISLDAGTTETLHRIKPGARRIKLEDILEAAEKLKGMQKERIEIEFSYVITNYNYQEIIESVKKVRATGADRIRFRIDLTDRTVSRNHGNQINLLLGESKGYEERDFHVVPVHSEEEVREEDENYFSSRSSGFKCFTCKFWACIGADSCLHPCGHIVSGDTQNQGSVLKRDLREIWNSESRVGLCRKLPEKKCSICSPFSKRLNEFLTFLSRFPIEEIKMLIQKQQAL